MLYGKMGLSEILASEESQVSTLRIIRFILYISPMEIFLPK